MGLQNEIIEKALRKAIDAFLKSMNEGVSLRAEGNIPILPKKISEKDKINLFKERLMTIDEGLIKTYPLDKSINFILKKYGLFKEQIQVQLFNNGITDVEIITVFLPAAASKNALGELKHDFKVCGYFPTNKPRRINDKYIALTFEPKFNVDVTTFVRENFQFLQHVTLEKYVNKIIKKGLIPKSNNSLLDYPDRIYLMVGDKLNFKQNAVISTVLKTKEDSNYIVVKIDVTRIPADVRFYADPMSIDAIFTHDNIPPDAIVDIKPFTSIKHT